MARGGRRAGRPGQAYGERTDLNATKKLPITTPTGMAYGAAKTQQDAQRQLPIAPPPSPPAGTPLPASPGPAPGELTPLHAPTARPDEPITAGLPIGAGPGPTPTLSTDASMAATLQSLAQATGHPDLINLAQRAQASGV